MFYQEVFPLPSFLSISKREGVKQAVAYPYIDHLIIRSHERKRQKIVGLALNADGHVNSLFKFRPF